MRDECLLRRPILLLGAAVLVRPSRRTAGVRLRRPHLRAATASGGLSRLATASCLIGTHLRLADKLAASRAAQDAASDSIRPRLRRPLRGAINPLPSSL